MNFDWTLIHFDVFFCIYRIENKLVEMDVDEIFILEIYLCIQFIDEMEQNLNATIK